MQGLFAVCGIILFLFLYGAGLLLTATTFKKTERWIDERRRCGDWPRQTSDLEVSTINQKSVSCELPELFRRREQTPGSTFMAKIILRNAYKKCVEDGVCNE